MTIHPHWIGGEENLHKKLEENMDLSLVYHGLPINYRGFLSKFPFTNPSGDISARIILVNLASRDFPPERPREQRWDANDLH